jgi:3-(3-hydroxy-phenyl)propionate hydroxylase
MPGEDPVAVQDPAVIEDLVARWVPRGSADVERIAVYAFHGLVAESWRDGRVLLAGDAAHQMPPFLGQGMNSGMRDAANLAWKLERVIRGGAPDQLLDTYESERKPHITEIVSAAVRIGRTVCTLDPAEAARRNRRLLAGAAPGELAFRLPALEPGPLVLQGGGRLFAQPVSDDGTRFDDVVGQRFLVLARDRRALGESATWWAQELGALVAAPEDFPAFAEPLSRSLDASGAAVVVARPDRYVLAVGDGLDGITASVREWLVSDVRV